jgi:hypothetical protein
MYIEGMNAAGQFITNICAVLLQLSQRVPWAKASLRLQKKGLRYKKQGREKRKESTGY